MRGYLFIQSTWVTEEEKKKKKKRILVVLFVEALRAFKPTQQAAHIF